MAGLFDGVKSNGLGGVIDGIGSFFLGDLHKSLSGSGLTGAEIESNQFNAEQAQLAWERNEQSAENQRQWQSQMDNTKVQRSISDMKAAGVNPAMMMGGSGVTASTPSGGVASGSAASAGASRRGSASLDSILNMAMIGQRFKESNAQIQLIKAETDKVKSEGENINKQNEWYDAVTQNSIDEAKSRIHMNYEVAATEESKRANFAADTMLKNANEEKVRSMLQYEIAYTEAQTYASKVAAMRDAVHAAYEQGLIDSGYIQATVREMNASASDHEQAAIAQEVETIIRSGNDPDGKLYDKDSKVAQFFGSVMAGLKIVKDAILPGGVSSYSRVSVKKQ